MERPIKVQFISSKPIRPYGTVQLRCLQPAEYLKDLGFETEVCNIRNTTPIRNGIIFFHRLADNQFTRSFLRWALWRGNVLIYDTDDLTINEKNSTTHIASKCHAISVSTSYIKTAFERVHPRVVLLKNALSEEFLIKTKEIRKFRESSDLETVTLAYLSGSGTHDKDFEIIQDVLLDMLRENQQLRLILGGKLKFSDQFQNMAGRFKYFEFMPYLKYVDLYKEIDINLAPLQLNSVFNQGRSELKYLEAGACGIPTIASPIQSYKEAIVQGENGMLAQESDWLKTIQDLISDPKMRQSIGRRALEHVSKEYQGHVRGGEYKELVDRLLASVKKRNNFLLNWFYGTLNGLWRLRKTSGQQEKGVDR